MIRSKRMLALLVLGLATAAPGEAADPQVVHKVELQSGTKAVTIEQRFVPVTGGTDVHLIARGPATGAKTVAVMYAYGELAVKVDKSWWKGFFSANGMTGDAELIPRKDGGRDLAYLAVTGAGGTSHLIGVSMTDPDEPWGPCPGPVDAPICGPGVVVIPFWCKYDVDQCSGGPLPWAVTDLLGDLVSPFLGIDPDGDPAAPDPDGDPARGLAVLRMSLEAAQLTAGGLKDLGSLVLPMDGRQGFERRGPGF